MDSNVNHRKPKLVFFQWDHSPYSRYAKYMMQHVLDHVRCLEQHFEVVVVNEDCDYGRICDRHEPDLTLFELGYQLNVSHRIDIRNTSAHPQIPKAGLLNADSWSWTRAGILSDLDRWGIGVCFSICTTIHDYLPNSLDGLYIWPNFIDPAVFRDYGAEKSVPVMLTGAQVALYPWRRRVFPLLSQSYPCLVCPPHTYADARAAQALTGERYARTLNASLFVPSCGTMAREIVRKHFEIPGAGSCLIAERTPMAEAAGFAHMDNCIFADRDDVLDLVDSLMRDSDKLRRITAAGHDLVHSRHTIAHRPQIHQWFQLHKALPPGRRIEQEGPFGDIVAVERAAPRLPVGSGRGADRTLLANGYASLWQGEFRTARKGFSDCLAYVADLPEGLFGLALCDLAEGEPAEAAIRLGRLIERTTVVHGAQDPDPAEWAVYLFALSRLGRDGEARRLTDWYPRLSHPALDHIRGLLLVPPDIRPKTGDALSMRPSIHDRYIVTKARGWTELLTEFSRLQPWSSGSVPKGGRRAPAALCRAGVATARQLLARATEFILTRACLTALRPNVPSTGELDYLRNVARQVRRAIYKTPFWNLAADTRRFLKARRERRELFRHADPAQNE
ncbi:glycosyltransferase family protein [Rhizobium leguminosarum]|uniref:glycosyltransferase family protein n=1 Tax=Rhizobium leguminosarum TaxID=384 RepID=UPI003F97A3D0